MSVTLIAPKMANPPQFSLQSVNTLLSLCKTVADVEEVLDHALNKKVTDKTKRRWKRSAKKKIEEING